MKRFIVALILSLPLFSMAFSQPDSTRLVHLSLQGGFAYGLYRDQGASPLTYRGLELCPGIGVKVQNSSWRIEAAISMQGGAYGLALRIKALQAYGGQGVLGTTVLRRVSLAPAWHIWLGGGISDCFDIRYNSQLGNASVGYSNFTTLSTVAEIEWQPSHWRLFGQLAIDPLSLMFRPGFAYMDNYDHNIGDPNGDTFAQYRFYMAYGTGFSTRLGVEWMLRNGNAVGLTYHWHFLTSRTSADGITAPHCFEQASHAAMFHLLFRL